MNETVFQLQRDMKDVPGVRKTITQKSCYEVCEG